LLQKGLQADESIAYGLKVGFERDWREHCGVLMDAMGELIRKGTGICGRCGSVFVQRNADRRVCSAWLDGS